MGLVSCGDSLSLSVSYFTFSLGWQDAVDFPFFSVSHLPRVGRHGYGHMLWRLECPHLYWAKLYIKNLIEFFFY